MTPGDSVWYRRRIWLVEAVDNGVAVLWHPNAARPWLVRVDKLRTINMRRH